MTQAAPGALRQNHARAAGVWRHQLTWLLLLAAALRLPLASWPNVIAPDEIYQFIEPAWRLLGHDSIISWEWRAGIRGWTVPTLLAGPIALGDWLLPSGEGLLIGPRFVASLTSLSIVAAAWGFGGRVSRTHAVFAAFVAAIWFEFILYAPHTLGEPLATAMILPAAWLLTQPMPSRRELAGAGMLLALAFVCRFQYAPAIAVLVIGGGRRDPARLVTTAVGGFGGLLVAGAIDAAHGAMPFGWLIGNITHNLLQGRADSFGTHPALYYVGNFVTLWSLALPPIVLAIWRGYKHAPLLVWMALTNLVVHSLIGHKEPRFIFLSIVLLVIVAALGSVDAMAWLRRRVGSLRWASAAVAAIWLTMSGTLAMTGVMPEQWRRGIGAAELAHGLRDDPATCGVALYDVPYFMLPGRRQLGTPPLYAIDPRDALAAEGAAITTRKAEAGFNRIVARRSMAQDLPADFTQGQCAPFYDVDVCIYARAGSCDAAAAQAFRLNDVLIRLDL